MKDNKKTNKVQWIVVLVIIGSGLLVGIKWWITANFLVGH
jgi:predicted negative regulator of RcsB-dependent stress response